LFDFHQINSVGWRDMAPQRSRNDSNALTVKSEVGVRPPPHFKFLNRNNTALHYSILLKKMCVAILWVCWSGTMFEIRLPWNPTWGSAGNL